MPFDSRRAPPARRPRAHLIGLSIPLLLALATGAAAQTPPIAALSLRQALEAAWQQQPERAAQDGLRQAAQARLSAAQAWTAEPPTLELSQKTDRLQGNEGSRELALGVAVPLWLPGERSRSQALAEAENGALDSRQAAAQWRLAGALREAWWMLQRARIEAGLAQARHASAAQLARDVARRVAAGELSRADQHQAEGALAVALAGQAAARAALSQAEQSWRSLGLDRPPAELPDSAERLPGEAAGLSEQHPALRELGDRLLRAERAQALAAVQQRANPELTLTSTRERGGFGERYGQTLTLGLRLPLGSGGLGQARQAATAAELAEARSQLALERQRLAAELDGAHARLAAAQAGAEAAARRASLAIEVRGFIEKSFRAGETDLPRRLQAELEAFEAERQSTLARLQLNQAISALNQALGLLPE